MTPEKIIEVVYDFYNADPSDVKAKDQRRETIRNKYTAIYFLCRYTSLTQEAISWLFGHTPPNGHCTVINALKNVENWRGTEKDYNNEITDIDKMFSTNRKKLQRQKQVNEEVFQENDWYK